MKRSIAIIAASIGVAGFASAQDRPVPGDSVPALSKGVDREPPRHRARDKEEDEGPSAPPMPLSPPPLGQPRAGYDWKEWEIRRLQALNAAYERKINLLEARLKELESRK